MTMQPIKNTYDVIIVGARCAGAATAMLLAARGLRVLVFDKSRYGSDTLSTHALMRPAVLLLHRWGLTDRLEEEATPPIRKTSFVYTDDQGSDATDVEIKPRLGVQALYAPRRTVLDRILVDAARDADVKAIIVFTIAVYVTGTDTKLVGDLANLADFKGMLPSFSLPVVISSA